MPIDEVEDEALLEEMPDPAEEALDEVALDEIDVDDDIAADVADDDEEVEAEALDELEAEELEMLTEDETAEVLVVDEAAEMRAIRRAELAMDQQGVATATEDEFVCSKCFLVLKVSQLANPRKKICKDCAGL